MKLEIGMRFNDWVIKEFLPKHHVLAVCQRCNKEHAIYKYNMTRGKSKGCSCAWTTHGESNEKETPEHKTWRCMKNRCHNPKASDYKNYGGRGIFVCQEWRDSYQQFLLDMGRRPVGTTLDRIDNMKGYYKENCRWATHAQQGENRRNNKILHYKGEAFTLTGWSRKTGIKVTTIRERLKRGWTIECVLETPV